MQRPGIVHADEHAQDFQRRIGLAAHLADHIHQHAHSSQRQIFAHQRDQHLIGCGQSIHSQHAQAGAIVDEDQVIFMPDGEKGLLQEILPPDLLGQFYVGTHQGFIGGQDVEVQTNIFNNRLFRV